MKHAALLVGCVLGLGCIILGWREIRHQGQVKRWSQKESSLLDQLQERQMEQQAMATRLGECEKLGADHQINIESLRDRSTNLAAQRDHLRGENERQAALLKEKSTALEQSQHELQAARHELLQQAAEPRRLEAEVNRRQARIEQLEASLDERATVQSITPTLCTVEGISSDGSIIALGGDLETGMDMPCPVQVCRRNEILLDCWISRIEDGILVGHIDRWRVPASALVKGEKVFILRINNHESDP